MATNFLNLKTYLHKINFLKKFHKIPLNYFNKSINNITKHIFKKYQYGKTLQGYNFIIKY